MKADAEIQHPFRLLITGKAKSGKTTLCVKKINENIRPRVQRLIVVCPTWESQKVFDPIRDMVKSERDVFSPFSAKIFEKIYEQLQQQLKIALEKGLPPIETCLLIDDMAGTKDVHGGRQTPFGQIAIQASHLHCSIFTMTQSPKAISPMFRENLDGVIAFIPQSRRDRDWLYEEYNGNMMKKETYMKMLKTAWKGFGNCDHEEFGKHFIFILFQTRSPTRYFADFENELRTKKNTSTTNEQ